MQQKYSRKRAGMVFECVPPVNGEAVRVSLEGNSTLVICDVFISGIGEYCKKYIYILAVLSVITVHVTLYHPLYSR